MNDWNFPKKVEKQTLEDRIKELEKRVKELEKALALLQKGKHK